MFYNVLSIRKNKHLNKNYIVTTLHKWEFKRVIFRSLKSSETEGSGTCWPRPLAHLPPVRERRHHPHVSAAAPLRLEHAHAGRPSAALPCPSQPAGSCPSLAARDSRLVPVCVKAPSNGRRSRAPINQGARSGTRFCTSSWAVTGACGQRGVCLGRPLRTQQGRRSRSSGGPFYVTALTRTLAGSTHPEDSQEERGYA